MIRMLWPPSIGHVQSPNHLLLFRLMQRVNAVLAALTFIVILFATTMLWPISDVGFESDLVTHIVVVVVPNSPADHAGLRVGDQILTLYGVPIQEVTERVNVLHVLTHLTRADEITVQRNGRLIVAQLENPPPTIGFQAIKLALALLGLICWATGYLLGVVRHQAMPRTPLVASFWLLMGGVTGSMLFTNYAAFPLFVGQVWLTIALLAPLAVYIHLWFPAPAFSPQRTTSIGRIMLAASVVCNTVVLGWVVRSNVTIGQLSLILLAVAPFSICLALAGSAGLLVVAYRRTTTAHVQRQIRLIALACLTTLTLWVLLSVVPRLVLQEHIVRGRWLMLTVGLIPLAYVAGGRITDLYRLDRVARRSLVHLLTASALTLLLGSLNAVVGMTETMALIWFAVAFVAFYHPVRQLWMGVLPRRLVGVQHQALDTTIQALTTTLHADELITILIRGVDAQFGQPALAFYHGTLDGPPALTLAREIRMPNLPVQICAGALTVTMQAGQTVIESWELQQTVASVPLTDTEQHLLAHPAIVLWCPLRTSQGHLLGLLVLGMRADLDPYRHEDRQGLERLMAAAALAFANNAAYTQQRDAESLIRQLYRHLQEAQDVAAMAVARELHDEVINGHVRLDIESLRQVAATTSDPALQQELQAVIESEQAVIGLLRRLCEQLYPTGLDDPLGLAAVLRGPVLKTQAVWGGRCSLVVSGQPRPVAAAVQREALRVTKEALANAVQHAHASMITVQLVYGAAPDDLIQLTIQDDGRTAEAVQPRAGHWGLRFMQESARAVGGHIHWHTDPAGGTTVSFRFRPDLSEEEQHETTAFPATT